MSRSMQILVLSLTLFLTANTSFAQSSQQTTITSMDETGMHPFGAYDGVKEDISLSTGNLHLQIPLLTFPGRGMNFSLAVNYDSKGAMPGFFPFFNHQYTIYWLGESGGPAIGPMALSVPTLGVTQTACQGTTTRYDWIFTDTNGTQHHFGTTWGSCTATFATLIDSDDSALIRLDTTNQSDFVVRMKDGTSVHFAGGFSYLGTGGTKHVFTSIVDTNGNTIQSTLSNGVLSSITDTVGRVYSFDFSNKKITYKDANGVSQSITFTQLTDNTGGTITYSHPTASDCTGGTFNLGLHSFTGHTTWAMTIPDGAGGLTYQFQFDAVGELVKITYPSGGYTKYDFQPLSTIYILPSSGITCSNVDFREVVAKHECRRSDGNCGPSPAPTPEDTTTYVATSSSEANSSMDVFRPDPSGTPNKTHYDFSLPNPYAFNYASLELHRYVYSGSTTLLQTVQTDYTQINSAYYDASLPIRVTTTLNDISPNLVSKVETDYDTALQYNKFDSTIAITNPIEVREFDYGLVLKRKKDTTWLKTGEYAPAQKHIMDRSLVITTYDGAGNQKAQTTNEYDNYTEGITASGATQLLAQDNYRGNVTAVSQWLNTTGGQMTTRRQYDDAGNVRKVADPILHSTIYSFADNWQDTSCVPTSGQAAAYATTTTNPLGQATTRKYFSCSGEAGTETDSNLLSTTYAYDTLGRRTSAIRSDSGTTTWTYNDVPPTSVTQNAQINQNLAEATTLIMDGLGRPIQRQITSDSQGTVYTDQTYDSLGRVASVSNPYRAGADPTTSSGTTLFTYDAFNRKTLQTYPDGSVLTTAYCGSSTLVTDPTAKWRRSRTDALGRLAEVDEPNAIGATVASTGCPGSGEPIWVTSYTYDTLSNLTSVSQNGSHQRNFTFDSLSRLLTSTNPEIGTITYKYDLDTNCSSPNSFPTLLVSKTDARGIRTCSQFDVLNREIVRNYSNGDPTVTTAFDGTNCLGLTSCSNIGHRTGMTDAAGSESWAFQTDAANHRSIHTTQRTTNGITRNATYVLDLAGNTTQVTYPTGRVVNFTFDGANRPSTATDGSNGITYATDFQSAPTGCLTGAVCYTPEGTFYALSIGQSSSFGGLNLTHTYNNRLQPGEFKASSSGGNAIDITYNFVDPATLKNAGHLYGVTNNLDNTRSQTFTYDQVDRVIGAQTTSTFATSPSHCWGETYTLDPWGNLNSIAATSNSAYTGCSVESGFSATADGNNHLPAWGYDTSGNATSDGFVTNYQWDGESQLKSAAGVNYLYDGDGRRVSKSNGKLYWYDGGSEILGETDASGNTTAEYIFFGGKRIAMLPAGGNPTYYVEDLLGTSRVLTTNTGVVCYDADFYPYGGERSYTNTCPQNYKFEGKERDTETGNDDFGARYYSNRFGRWLSADWSSTPVPVPYANLSNPQTLNLYSMVADDPESFADLDGHQTAEADPEREDPKEEKDPVDAKERFDIFELIREDIEARAAAQKAQWDYEFWTAHPNGYDNPWTGQCFAPNPDAGKPVMRSRNPYGSNGKPDHQEGVKQDREDLQKEAKDGEHVPPSGTKIQGHESNRRPDNQIVDANGKTRKVVERERRPNSKRNKQREKEYDKLGVKHETRPVKKPPVKTPPVAPNTDDCACDHADIW